jgi:hypothetical protein
MASLSPAKIRAAVAEEYETQGDGATLKTLRRAAEENLGLAPKALDAHKDLVRECAEGLVNAATAGPGSGGPAAKKARAAAAAPPPGVAADAPTAAAAVDPPELAALKAMARAVAAGPRILLGLREAASVEDQCDLLRARLREKGCTFKGQAPSQKEVAAAKAATERRRDLEGMDPSLIITDARRRGDKAGARRGASDKPPVATVDDGCDSEASFDC